MPKPMYVMTLGQLRAQTAELPDETALFVGVGDDVNSELFEVTVERVLPATSTQYPALVLAAGQTWDTEYEIYQRVDDHIGYVPPEVEAFLDELDALPDGEEPV